MENKAKIFIKAGNRSTRTITFVAAIAIALMISVGITIAQQTQGTVIVEQTATTATVVDDGCPCHQNDGGVQTMSGDVICPGIISGIAYIQSQGEAWYNNMVQSSSPSWNPSPSPNQLIYLLLGGDQGGRGDDGSGDNSGSGGFQSIIQSGEISHSLQSSLVESSSVSTSVSISEHLTPVPHLNPYGFLSWATLQTRFDAILAYNNGGPVPSFWTPQMTALYTSAAFCNSAQNCFWMYAVGQTWIAGVWMALGAAGQAGAGMEMWLIGQVGMGAMLVMCLESSGWAP